MAPQLESLLLHCRRFTQRAINYLKPAPQYMPLTVDQLLSAQSSNSLIERFNDLCYKSGTPGWLNWRGDEILKNPCDLWMIVEILQRVRPALLVETGTHRGGSASFYADIMRILGLDATIITIDLNPKWSFDPRSKNIVSVIGYSTDSEVVGRVERAAKEALDRKPGPGMLLLDSAHDKANVLSEMQLYSKFVSVGSYMIVEDTNINGHPSSPDSGPGPWEAVDEFLALRSDFAPDRECERYLMTYFPRGWLKRLR